MSLSEPSSQQAVLSASRPLSEPSSQRAVLTHGDLGFCLRQRNVGFAHCGSLRALRAMQALVYKLFPFHLLLDKDSNVLQAQTPAAATGFTQHA